MNLKNKKILAREFLLLVMCLLVFGFAYLGTIVYNSIQNQGLIKIEKERQVLKDEINKLQLTYSNKVSNQVQFFYESLNNRWHIRDWDYKDLWSKLGSLREADSINYKWKNTWNESFREKLKNRFGIENYLDFENFIDENTITAEDIENGRKVKQLKTDLNKIEQKIILKETTVLTEQEQMAFSHLCLIAIVIVLFPIRYLFFGIKWSVKTLKENK